MARKASDIKTNGTSSIEPYEIEIPAMGPIAKYKIDENCLGKSYEPASIEIPTKHPLSLQTKRILDAS